MGAPACKRDMCQRLKYTAALQLSRSLILSWFCQCTFMSPRKACADPRSRGLRQLDYMSISRSLDLSQIQIPIASPRTWRVGFLLLVRCGSSLDLPLPGPFWKLVKLAGALGGFSAGAAGVESHLRTFTKTATALATWQELQEQGRAERTLLQTLEVEESR